MIKVTGAIALVLLAPLTVLATEPGERDTNAGAAAAATAQRQPDFLFGRPGLQGRNGYVGGVHEWRRVQFRRRVQFGKARGSAIEIVSARDVDCDVGLGYSTNRTSNILGHNLPVM